MALAFSRKKKTKEELLEKEACDQRLRSQLEKLFVMVENVRGLFQHLVQDDRIVAEYIIRDANGEPVKTKLLAGGFYRFYDSTTDMVCVSPFLRPTELGLISLVGAKKVQMLRWNITNLSKIYIMRETEARILASIKAGRRASQPPSQATTARAVGMDTQ